MSKPDKENNNLIVAIFLKRDPLENVESRTPQSELYYCILDVVMEFSAKNRTSATNLIKEKVDKGLYNNITSRVSRLTNNGSCIPDDLNNTSNLKTEFFRLFSAEIRVLASLFNSKKENEEDEKLIESLLFTSANASIPM